MWIFKTIYFYLGWFCTEVHVVKIEYLLCEMFIIANENIEVNTENMHVKHIRKWINKWNKCVNSSL